MLFKNVILSFLNVVVGFVLPYSNHLHGPKSLSEELKKNQKSELTDQYNYLIKVITQARRFERRYYNVRSEYRRFNSK